jgi:hypothetical protein
MLQFDAAPFVASNAFGVNGKQFPSHNRKMLGDVRTGARETWPLRPFATELKAPPSCCSAAVEALLLVVELNGPATIARIGLLRALNRNVQREFDTSRKDTHWGRRKLKRDE